MNLGNMICKLRKKNNITQDMLAAELGVTAAAVSKWENGYTLPDVLMLCALADYFRVTTDELLDRNPRVNAIIAASTPELGAAIREFIKGYGFTAKQICLSYGDALDAARSDPLITHLFASFDKPLGEDERGDTDGVISIESQAATPQQVLDGFAVYLKKMSAIDSLAKKS